MALDKMRSSIIKDAETKAAGIESEASKNAAQIIADAKSEAAAIGRKADEEAKAEMNRVEMEKRSDLENIATALMNTAEAEAVASAMDKVLPRLSEILSKQNLDKMLKSAIKEMEKTTKDIVITVDKKTAASLKGYEVRQGNGDGFVIESKDGRIRLDATPSKIAEENAELARAEISAFMFGKKHGGGAAKAVVNTRGKTAKPGRKPSKKSRSKR